MLVVSLSDFVKTSYYENKTNNEVSIRLGLSKAHVACTVEQLKLKTHL